MYLAKAAPKHRAASATVGSQSGVGMDVIGAEALQISRAIQTREISAVELMQVTLARIEAVNGRVNAIVSLRDADALLEAARQADDIDPQGWLHGIPMAIKNLAHVAGMPTSFGSPLHAGEIAQTDDVTVARFRAAGAIFIGKTNTPEFGFGSHSVNPVHGATCNPYDLTKSAGGSSGGAGAALATGMVCLADGSDAMGSLRNPAAWNNVYGMRPTWGLVPDCSGGEAYFSQLATHGPMARSPADLAALLDTMAGRDARAPQSLSHNPVLPSIDALSGPVRLASLGDWGGAFPMEAGILDGLQSALDQMAGLGWHVEDHAAPFPATKMWRSWTTLRSFNTANNKRVDYENPDRRAQLGPAMIWEIEQGRALDATTIWEASAIRSDWFRCCAELFARFDFLVLPSTQLWPFDVTKRYPETIAGTQMDTYHRWMEVVIPASLIGLPVVNLPCGFGENGLPVGVQLIGCPGSDARLLQAAQRWHLATEWPQNRPAMI